MILGYSRMNNFFVCLVLALCTVETNGFMHLFQRFNNYRQSQQFMDEGMEYVRETPTFAYNNFIRPYARTGLNPYTRAEPSQNTQAEPSPNTQAEPSLYTQAEPSPYTKAEPVKQAPKRQNIFANFLRRTLLSRYRNNMNGGLGGLTMSKGFLDEGFEHVRERGTFGQMQSLMSHPNLFLSSLFM